jgi:hypothetical protein
MGDALDLQYEPLSYLLRFFTAPFSYLLPRTRGLAHLFDSFPVCPRPILVVCGLLPGDNNLNSGGHRDSKPAKFSVPVCFPTGETGKNAEADFMRWSPVCHCRKQWVAKSKILISIVKVDFSKIVTLKGMIRKLLNTLAVQIEGIRYPPYAYLIHFFVSMFL